MFYGRRTKVEVIRMILGGNDLPEEKITKKKGTHQNRGFP